MIRLLDFMPPIDMLHDYHFAADTLLMPLIIAALPRLPLAISPRYAMPFALTLILRRRHAAVDACVSHYYAEMPLIIFRCRHATLRFMLLMRIVIAV